MTGTLGLLERTLGQTESIIAEIRPEQATLPTPCPQWTVRDVVQHVVGSDLRNFTAVARGETTDWLAPPEPLGEDWVRQFRAGAHELFATWGRSNAPPGPADQQIAELAVHGWDLTTATGVGVPLDEELAEHALAWSQDMLRPQHRGPDKAFGREVPVPADAPAYARLAGWFGRDPAWRPA
jgi:uncharacterized protein (TIGR03086 family)